MSLKYTPVTKSILCLIFLLHIRTIQRLKYGGQKSIKEFSVSDVNIPVTLKQGQGHQTWYKLVDPKQGYNNVKFIKKDPKQGYSNVKFVKTSLEQCEKANNKVFTMKIISFEYVQKSKLVVY